jgi:hypothetical protein
MIMAIEQRDDVSVLRIEGDFVTGTDSKYLAEKKESLKQLKPGKVLVDLRHQRRPSRFGGTTSPGARSIPLDAADHHHSVSAGHRFWRGLPWRQELPRRLSEINRNSRGRKPENRTYGTVDRPNFVPAVLDSNPF